MKHLEIRWHKKFFNIAFRNRLWRPRTETGEIKKKEEAASACTWNIWRCMTSSIPEYIKWL